jgi:6-phosphogluconolactonase
MNTSYTKRLKENQPQNAKINWDNDKSISHPMIFRNRFIGSILAMFFLFLSIGLMGCSVEHQYKEIIYVGTFDGRDSQGLYVFELNRETGEMIEIQTVSDRSGPNFQAIHPNGNTLYSISGDAFSEDLRHGTISAYRINSESGHLQLINENSVVGRGPAHVSVDPLGRFVYVSNYSEGNLSVFKVNEDGSLSEAIDVVYHEGSSIHPRRQGAPYVHSIIPSNDGKFIYVSDLGIDKIMIYEVGSTGELSPAQVPYVENTPGSGPRHFAIHPNGNYAYSAEELTSTVAVFTLDQNTGALSQVQRVNMLPEEFEGSNTAADIHISPDGLYLYASNRGHDSLVIYRIDEKTGTLTFVGHEPSGGGHPRNFMIDNRGEFILVANRDNDNVVMFRRDKNTGELALINENTGIPMAICVTQHFLQIR